MKKLFTYTILLILIAAYSNAQIIHVPSDQPSIQAGIGAAGDGDTVLVAQGTYYENINFYSKAITVASQYLIDPDSSHIYNTIIDGSEPALTDFASVVTFLTGEDTTSILCGFTITGGTGMYLSNEDARMGGGIICYYASAKIIHNIITGNEVNYENHAWGAGIACIRETGDSWMVVRDNIINNNQSLAGSGAATGGGIEVWGNARVCNNIIEDNYCYSESGFCGGGGVANVSINNPSDTLCFDHNLVRNNTILSQNFFALGGGLFVENSTTLLSNCIFEYNQCDGHTETAGGGIRIYDATVTLSSNTFRYNSAISNNVSLGGGVSLWYCNSYLGNNTISHNSSSSSNEADGAGVHFYYPGMIEFEYNLISNNQVSANNYCWGAGVVCLFPTAKVDFSNNDFVNNSGPELNGLGGGLSILDAFDNEVIIDANRFTNNSANHGGGFLERSCYNLLITNNLFSENITYRGGAIGMYHPATRAVKSLSTRGDYRPRIINNTLCSNSASDHAGAIRLNCAINVPIIVNNIFYENSAPSGNDIWYFGSDDPVTVAYNNINTNEIFGPWTGEANIYENPEFEEGDTLYHLSGLSPCIGTGTASLEVNGEWYDCPPIDYEGDPRPDPFGNVDIGADEYFHTGIKESKFQFSNFNFQIYPNPSYGISDIRYQISDIRFVILEVFDVHGQKVMTLTNEKQAAGEHVVQFDGAGLPTGMYLVKLQVGNVVETTKVLLIQK